VLNDGGTVAIDWVHKNNKNDNDNNIKTNNDKNNNTNNDNDNDNNNKTNNNNDNDNKSSLILILHGLCGHSYSEYVSYFVKELIANGYCNIACMIARGCGSIEMTTGEVYSAAQANDIRAIIKHGITLTLLSF
jgi:predicted alpha/beta-fold hydrolase